MAEVAAAQTALVTGASRGIGRELAIGLSRAGLDVALLARDERLLESTADEVRAAGRRAVVLTADVTDEPGPTHDEVAERMSANLCRCAAYAHIVPAVQQAAGEVLR